MEQDTTLYQHLRKLSGVASLEEALDHILPTLWRTRRTGLRPSDKSHIQSLLNLPSPAELDPVLACLRSLIRKCVHHSFNGDDLLKLFPPDLPPDLQTVLVLSLHKYQNQWKDELSREPDASPRTSESYQLRTSVPPSFTSLQSSSEISTILWPHEDDPVARLNGGANDLGAFAPSVVGAVLPDSLEILPRLKSMTWTTENRVAVICLKLQDYSKSPLGEVEVKFQLTRDTLEAMLKSMSYISEKLSSMVGNSLMPAQKKQKQ